MADYLPVFKPGEDTTITLTDACTGGQLLVITGPGAAAPSSVATHAWVGVAAFDAPAGARVSIHKGGKQRFTATGTITAGDRVMPAAGGTVQAFTGTDFSQIVGLATTSAANGAAVDVDVLR